MKVVVYGATGNAGSKITSELLSRRHKVKAIARDVSTISPIHGLLTRTDDLSDCDSIAKIVLGADVVVSAYNPPADDPNALVEVTRRLIAAIAQSGVPRFLMGGGCGLLQVAPGVTLIKSGQIPVEYMPLALAHEASLAVLRELEINWTFLSCALYFVAGERTGNSG